MLAAIADPETTSKTKTIPMYKVLLLNDNKTTMEFVVGVLHSIFNKTGAEAVKIMLEVHETGAGLAGVYTKELAELKQDQTISLARARQYPLQVTIELA